MQKTLVFLGVERRPGHEELLPPVPAICDMYSERRRSIYSIGYSARGTRQGSEVMFFSDTLKVPPLVGPVIPSEQPPYMPANAIPEPQAVVATS
jgi:hypothetical protein